MFVDADVDTDIIPRLVVYYVIIFLIYIFQNMHHLNTLSVGTVLNIYTINTSITCKVHSIAKRRGVGLGRGARSRAVPSAPTLEELTHLAILNERVHDLDKDRRHIGSSDVLGHLGVMQVEEEIVQDGVSEVGGRRGGRQALLAAEGVGLRQRCPHINQLPRGARARGARAWGVWIV
jgi:hypothetical protein